MDPDDGVRVFVGDTSGPEEYVAFFEASDGTDKGAPTGGCLYVSHRREDRVTRHLVIYKNPGLDVSENDVQIFWSSDGNKCGIAIWGRMRGVIDLANGREKCVLLEERQSEAITDAEWLKGFDGYLDQYEFIRSRQCFWKDMVKRFERDAQPMPANEETTESNFVLYAKGPDNWFAVFEDDGSTGYLYLYNSKEQKITEHIHNYDRSRKLTVAPQDVAVVWGEDGNKCGVIICDKMRGIIDLKKSRPGRVWMEDRDTPGITDPEWLKGFEYLHS